MSIARRRCKFDFWVYFGDVLLEDVTNAKEKKGITGSILLPPK